MRKILFAAAVSVLAITSCRKDTAVTPGEKLSVSIEVTEITETSAKAVFEPTSASAPYICGYIASSDLSEWSDDVKRYLDSKISHSMEDSGMDRAEAVSVQSVTGTSSADLTGLVPETSYVCYAVGVDASGFYTSDVFSEVFTTSEADDPLSGLSFEIEIPSVTSTTVSISVLPSDNTLPYYFDIMTKDEYETYEGDVAAYLSYVLETVANNYGVSVSDFASGIQEIGPSSDQLRGLSPDSEYVAYAIGLSGDGTCFGQPAVKEFRTEKAGNPEDCTFTFSIEAYMGQAEVTVSPSDDGVGYFTAVIPVSEYSTDDALVERVYNSIIQSISGSGMSIEDAVALIAFRGLSTETYDLEEGSYYAFAYAFTSDGKAAGAVYKQIFDVQATVSDVSVSVKNVKWFDGNALADADPAYEGIRGGAYFTADVVHSSDASAWYLGLSAGDMTDAEAYPDETVYDALMMGGVMNRERLTFVVQYGKLTVLGFATDASGVYGGIYRLLVDVTEEGASPVSEFNTSASTAASHELVLQSASSFSSEDCLRLPKIALSPVEVSRLLHRNDSL